MKAPRLFLSALVLGVAFLPPASYAGESVTIQVEGELAVVDPTGRTGHPPFRPGRALIELVGELPAGAPAVSGDAAEVHHGSWAFDGKLVPFALAKSSTDAEGHDLLFIDLDGDGAYGEGEKREMEVTSRPMRDGGTLLLGSGRELAMTAGELTWPFNVAWGKSGNEPLKAQVIALWYLTGKVKVEEKVFVIDVLDAEADGSFAGDDDHWLLRGDGPVIRRVPGFSLSTKAEKRFFGEELFAVTAIEGLTMKVTHGPADGPDAASNASHRQRVEHMWAERFDAEKEKFVARFEVDLERPLTRTPIAWRYVTFDEAQAMAKEEGKPLFVDVLAFWCVWCYRMDYYTYPDAEVAELLNTKFIPVKIVEEQDHVGDAGRIKGDLGAKGIPAMGVWGPDGQLRGFISGWKKAEEFIALLSESLVEPEDAKEAGTEGSEGD